MTRTQADALKWLRERNADGCFDLHGVVLAAGESAPFMRSTWNALRKDGLVEFYAGTNGRKFRRLRVTPAGMAAR